MSPDAIPFPMASRWVPDDEQLATLVKLTERYCVVLQTLAQATEVSVECGVE